MSFITIGSASHIGMQKTENQDYHAYYVPDNAKLKTKGILLALADGMGGMGGGSLASKTAVDTLMEAYYNDDTSGSVTESLTKAFLKANAEVIAKGTEHIETARMGATLVAVVIKKNNMYYAHVGDSRGYLIYGNDITQFTEDHSYVNSLVKAGVITAEQAQTHPERHVITRAIGLSSELTVDTSQIDQIIKKNQYILLCCDGLHGVVSDEVIVSIVNECREPDVICQKLVDKANENGGPDNITVLIARIDKLDLISSLTNRLKNLVG
uniref:Stp1/IreP family PP2C-type Ser/Thr phosphatase n=1 Tax=Candidatus Desulfatibia profunda TaxID=2841695 RepID=A0A8J6TK56_9BACT|nr:Stp1/IreP family PP2C-type Ser/Thr phosphatase [Candidatus Desulfatibia profunda]